MAGRKRHILVDTNGLLLALLVHEGSVQDRDGGPLLMKPAAQKLPTLKKLWLDGGYRGRCERWLRTVLELDAEVVLRSDDRAAGVWQQQSLPLPKAEPVFRVVPRRWVVERTFAWLGRYRRLSKDYEALVQTSAAWVWVAMVRLLTQRLAHPPIL